jgi:ParB family transcriptional regulator, chromosome partitioning protein
MKFSNINPFELAPNPWNSNRVNRNAFERLKDSLKRHGAFKPVVVRELSDGTLQIIGGYHRNEAAKELGWTEVPVINLGDIPDSQAKEIGIIDNTRYGEDDKELLEAILDELEDLDGLEAVLPDEPLLELPEEDELLSEPLKEPEPTSELTRTLKFKLETEKAEEIEAILKDIAEDHDYKYSDGYTNFGEALYHALVLGK